MGWRLLNGVINPRVQCIPLRPDEAPELVYVKVEDGLEIAHDPNSMAVIKIDSPKDFAALRERPPNPHIMARYKPNFQRQPSSNPPIKMLVLETTHDCNLACSYCFLRQYYADHGTGNYMTFPTAKAAIDRLLNPKEELKIGFFGGEPLLNMSLIRDVIAYAESLAIKEGPVCRGCGGTGLNRGGKCSCLQGKIRPKFHVTTNGTLYSPEILAFLKEHKFSLITSIDGSSEAHDALRPMKRSGRGSHKQIMNGLARLKELAPELAAGNTLRSTFTAMKGETIRTRVEFLNQICDDGMASWVSVEPAALSENSCFQPNQDELEVHVGNIWNLFYEDYLDTANWWMERARAGKQPRFHNLHKTLERLFWTVHAGTECGAGAGYVAVNSKGEIFGCHRESNSYIGTLVNGIDPKLRAPWLDNRIYNRPGCMTCGRRYSCGGGCREDSIGATGNIHEAANAHCAIKDLWTRSAFKVMAQLDKQTIAQFVANPGGYKESGVKSHKFISPSQLVRDAEGIVLQRWVDNIPLVSLVKDGIEDAVDIPAIREEPLDHFIVDHAFNPSGPVEIDAEMSNLLR